MKTPIQMLTHRHKCWGNVGFYFAQRGFVTVLANHRLVPHVVYPGGADDMQLAREWIFENIAKQKYGRGSPEKVILLGHSSGGAHIAMNLYAAGDEFLDNTHHHSLLTREIGDPKRESKVPLFPPVAGVIYLSVPFWFDRRKPVRQRVIRHYYGSDAEEVWGVSQMNSVFYQILNCITACFCPRSLQKFTRRLSIVVSIFYFSSY